MAVSTAAVTVSVTAGEVTAPLVAVMLAVPAVAEVADPLLPAALLMVATPVFEDDQVTLLVRFCVELSE